MNPNVIRGAKIAGYVAWFFAAFVVGIYYTFPLDELKGMIVGIIEDQLGKGKQGPYGVDPKVDVGSLSLSGFGVKATRVSIQMPSRDPDPGPTIDLDKLAIGVRPWSVLTKNKTVWVDAVAYGGSVDAVATVDPVGNVQYAKADVDSIDLSKVPIVMQKLGFPVAGKINVKGSVDLGATPEKDGTGDIKVDIKNLSVGPGDLKLAAAFGGFQVPLVDLGSLSGEIPIKQGKGSLQGVKLDGKDVQAELIGDVYLRGKLPLSRFDIDGWFQPMPAFLEREKKIQSLLDLGDQFASLGGPSLSKAKDEDGHYWFGLKGTAQAPLASLARDNGKHAKMKSSTPPPPTPPETGAKG
jgi:type II secretion system protein N